VRGAGEPARRVLRLAMPMVVGLGVFQINTFLDGLIASYPATVGETILGVRYPLDVGAMSAVTFAQRLYQFPLGVFGIAVATAIFPALARQAHSEAEGRFVETLRRGVRLSVFIALPASVGLILVGRPLVEVVLQGGSFTTRDSQAVSFVLFGYASGVWAYSLTHLVTRAYYARDDVRTPVRVAVAMVVLNLVLNCALIWTPLREAGLAWSTAICAMVQVFVLLRRFRRHVAGALDRSVWTSWARSAALGAAMALVVVALGRALPEAQSWGGALADLGARVGAGAFIVAGGAVVLRMPELRWALGRA
jgi:putative peptidoglycan lipid II flippase